MQSKVNLEHPESGRPCLVLVAKNPKRWGQTAGCPSGKTNPRRGNKEDKKQEENRFTMPEGVWHRGRSTDVRLDPLGLLIEKGKEYIIRQWR